MDWTTYATYSAVALSLSLLFVFLSSIVKPLGKHLAESLITRLRDARIPENLRGGAEPHTGRSNTAPPSALDAFKGALMDTLAPALTKLLQGVMLLGGGVGALLGGAIVLATVWIGLVLGVNPFTAASGAGGALLVAGAVEFWLGKRTVARAGVRKGG